MREIEKYIILVDKEERIIYSVDSKANYLAKGFGSEGGLKA